MKLKDHVQKLYEGGLIDEQEYQGFNSRYHTSSGEETVSEQETPPMSSQPSSPLPSQGPDRYLTAETNDYRNDDEPEEVEEPSREFLDALKRRRRS